MAQPTGTGVPLTDFADLIDEMAPLAEPLGWEVQRAYRVDAEVVGRDGDLVNVYLRPIGDEPSPAEYLADATTALRVIATDVFADDPSVTAIDVCLQRPNADPPEVGVPPALRILAFRDDLEPLLENDVQLAELVRLSRERLLVLFLDEYVKQAAGWADALASGTTGP